MKEFRLETVVLELLAGVLLSSSCANALGSRSTGNYDPLGKKLEGGYCIAVVLEKVDFLPPCHCTRKLDCVPVAVRWVMGPIR